jgi:hypothetical protein
MGEKRKPILPSAIQVKNQLKTIGTEEKLDVISGLTIFLFQCVLITVLSF